MSRFIPLSVPNFEGNERKYVDDAIGDIETVLDTIIEMQENLIGGDGV